MALAFLPVAIVRLTFTILEQQANDIIQPLFQYLRREWLNAKPPLLWNMHKEYTLKRLALKRPALNRDPAGATSLAKQTEVCLRVKGTCSVLSVIVLAA